MAQAYEYYEDKKDFLGKGMKFPPAVNPVTGKFMTVEGKDNVKESIYLILMTMKTERIMNPSFGSNAQSYVFRDTGNSMLTVMAREIENDILRNEPRVIDVDITMDTSKPGTLIVSIDYYIAGSNTPDNLVFPFYLGEYPGEESIEYEAMDEEIE